MPYRRAVAATWRGACILGPAPPSACVRYFEPFDLGRAPIAVHKDSSQHHASLGKAALTGRILLLHRSALGNRDRAVTFAGASIEARD